MRRTVVILVCAIVSLLPACGSKHVSKAASPPTQIASSLPQSEDAHLFAALSLDDIRNNIELFDTEIVVTDSAAAHHGRQPILSDEREARLIDIAIPCGAQLLDAYAEFETKDNEMVLGYISMMSAEELIHFYTEQMERLGWSRTCHVRGHEELLSFEKPGRLCNVVLRSVSNPDLGDFTKIVLFVTSPLRHP